ncbi:MAG: hypothetical protein CM15mV42_1020 [uncultured marine virus]|nr:MAG: hypothetical protein CM15mV42_1020 [uncultured marine virus]
MFTENGFQRALERADSIYNELASDPILSKLKSNDITVLLDPDTLDQELNTLAAEIAVLEDTKENEKIKKQKLEKLKKLTALRQILTDPKNLSSQGIYDRRRMPKLTKAFEQYVQFLADTEKGFVDRSRIEDVLKKIVDYKALKGRARVYDKAIQYLADPGNIDAIVDRQYAINKELFKKNRADFLKRIKNYVGKQEANGLLNRFMELDVYPDADQVEAFLKTGDARYLMTFFNEKGAVDPKLDKALYAQIQDAIDDYKEMTKVEEDTSETDQEEAAETQKSTDKIDEVLEDADIDSPISQTFGSQENVNPVVKTLLNKLYRQYRRTQLALKKPIKEIKSQKEWLNSKEALVANKAYEAIKQLWYQTIKDKYTDMSALDQVYKSDEGLITWLMTQETNPDIRTILEEAGLTFDNFYSIDSTGELQDNVDISYPGKPVATGAAYVVLKIDTVDENGKAAIYYQIKTVDNTDISDEILNAVDIAPGATFTNLNKATKKFDELEKLIPSDKEFVFDGVTLYNGALVTDSKGNQFVVTSTPRFLAKHGKLSILPVDKTQLKGKERRAATISLKPGEFKNEYTTEELNFKKLPKNVSRLTVNEAVRPFAHTNGRFTDKEESRESAFRRYDAIMDMLTPEERATLEIVVSRNPSAGNTIEAELKYTNKEANPFISRVSDTYTIGIRIGDPEIRERIDKELLSKGIKPTDSVEGIFAYMPNNGVIIKDGNGKQVDPRNMDQETAANTFIQPKGQADALNKIKNNFAVQANFVKFVEDKLGNNESAVIKLYELADQKFSFLLDSFVDNTTPPKSLNDLAYNTVDGNIIIFDNRLQTVTDENGKTISTRRDDIKTNIQDVDEETKVIEEVKAALGQRVRGGRTMLEMAQTMGAYVAVIKSPSGEYTLAELKATEATEEQLNDLFKKLVDRAALTRKENLSDPKIPSKSKRKSLGYNVDFNNTIKNEVFIATKSGYNIAISVDPGGRIEFNIIDKATRKKLLVHTKGKLKGKGNPVTISYDAVEQIAENENYIEAFQKAMDLFNDHDVTKQLGIKLEMSSIRQSFDKKASVSTIVDSTTTTLDDRVRFNYRLVLKQDSAQSNASEDVPSNANQAGKKDSTEKKNDVTLEERLQEMSQNVDAPIGEITEVEYKNFIDNGTVSNERIESIAKKVMQGDVLSARESAIMADKTKDINDKIVELSKSDPELSFEQQKKNLEDAIKKRKKEIINEGSRKGLRKRLETDKELKSLTERLNNLTANKIISPDMNLSDLEDINVFRSWAAANLPTSISIDDIMTLGNNMKAGGMRVGAFVLAINDIAGGMNVKGTIYTGANSPFRYHEAFHGVFRMLLTDAEITKYLGIARREVRAKLRAEGKSFKEELERFRNSADTYAEMSEKRLIQEYYEEYLADQFEIFKTNPSQSKTSSENKSLFSRIMDWIRAVLGAYSRNELTELFQNIDAGKYKSASVVQNRFTQEAIQRCNNRGKCSYTNRES